MTIKMVTANLTAEQTARLWAYRAQVNMIDKGKQYNAYTANRAYKTAARRIIQDLGFAAARAIANDLQSTGFAANMTDCA